MRILLSMIAIIFFSVCSSVAQLKPVHQTELAANCEQVFVHSRTGIPIFKTRTSYIAIHPETFETLWETKRQGAAALAESTPDNSFSDYFELPGTTITYIGNSFVEVVSGVTLADGEADEIKRISSFQLFPAHDLLIVKVAAKGAYRLYGFDPVKNALRWRTDIDKIGALSLGGLTDNNPIAETLRGLKPYIASTGDIVYVHQKDMMLVDPATGKLKWSQSLEPGAVLFSQTGKLIAVAERRVGLGGMMDLSGGSKFGKKLVVVDAATGENAWKKEIKLDGNIKFMQPYRDGFIVAHDEGFNIYDFNSPKGEGQWKKDFSAKDISDIVEDGQHIMVYYKDRRMLMDPESGDDVWKKPEKLKKETPVFSGGHVEIVGKVKITHSGSMLRFVHDESDSYEVIPANQYVVDKEKNAVYATYEERKQNAAGLTTSSYFVYAVNLDNLDIQYQEIGMREGVRSIDVVKGGFFIHGPQAYYLCRLVDGKLTIFKHEYYPNPGASGRGLLSFATTAVFSAGYISGAVGSANAMVVGSEEDYQRYSRRMENSANLGNVAFAYQKRSTLAHIDKDYAFFFSRDADKNLALFQIRKVDGEEVARYQFDDKTPVYEVDYTNGNLYYMNGKSLKIFRLQVI